VLERVREEVAARSYDTSGGPPIAVTVSIGVAAVEPGESAADLLERVSSRLLAAKGAGRNCVR
jgi:PleD family two-component response regulator